MKTPDGTSTTRRSNFAPSGCQAQFDRMDALAPLRYMLISTIGSPLLLRAQRETHMG